MSHIKIAKPKPQKPNKKLVKTSDTGLSCIPTGNTPDH